jgi:hypothetical protein
MFSWLSVFFNGVVGGIRDSHRPLFEQFSDTFCFSPYIHVNLAHVVLLFGFV